MSAISSLSALELLSIEESANQNDEMEYFNNRLSSASPVDPLLDLHHLATVRRRPQKFALALKRFLGLLRSAPTSLVGFNFIIMSPGPFKGTYWKFGRKKIYAIQLSPESDDKAARDAEYRVAMAAGVFYFAGDHIGQWVTECGGNLRECCRTSWPRHAIEQGIRASNAIPGRKVIVRLPLATLDLEGFPKELFEVWTLAQLIRRMTIL